MQLAHTSGGHHTPILVATRNLRNPGHCLGHVVDVSTQTCHISADTTQGCNYGLINHTVDACPVLSTGPLSTAAMATHCHNHVVRQALMLFGAYRWGARAQRGSETCQRSHSWQGARILAQAGWLKSTLVTVMLGDHLVSSSCCFGK